MHQPPAIQPLLIANDDEWVVMIGRYMLNMGSVEMATRLVIARIEGTDSTPIFSDDLAVRLGFIRKRFPRKNATRHKWAMNALAVAIKHSGFRNIIAHSPLVVTEYADGSRHIQGIMNLTPKSTDKKAEIISIEELKGRVNESAVFARQLLEMQSDFSVAQDG